MKDARKDAKEKLVRIADFVSQIQNKRQEAEKRVTEALAELNTIDAQIEALGHHLLFDSTLKPNVALENPANQVDLAGWMECAFANKDNSPMTVLEMQAALREMGHPAASTRYFRDVVNKTLSRKFKRVRRGVYKNKR